MKSDMKKSIKANLLITTLSIISVTMVLLGNTYAWFSTAVSGNKENVINVGTLQIAFSNAAGDILNLDGAYPMSNSEGMALKGYNFTIKNTGTLVSDYSIRIESDESLIASDNCSSNLLDWNNVMISFNDSTPVVLATLATDNYVLQTGSLKPGKTKTNNIKLWLKEDSSNDVLGRHFHGKLVVDGVQSEVQSVPTGAEYIESLLATNSSTMANDDPDGNVRYMGINPNNYVSFNNGELWRIIGVFNVDDGSGNVEKRIKLIRSEPLISPTYNTTGFSWDSTPMEVNGGQGQNGWILAYLMLTLNKGPYWNRTTGICLTGSNAATTDCDFSDNGLTAEAKSLISDVVWNIGTIDGVTYTDRNTSPLNFYIGERSLNTGKICDPANSNCNDNMPRESIWIGTVGLMYPSDYGYATSGGTTYSRTDCINKEMYNWDSSSYKTSCVNTDWLLSSKVQWTLTSCPNATIASKVFSVNSGGYVNSGSARDPNAVRPVVYLKADVNIIKDGNDGSYNKPYNLSL